MIQEGKKTIKEYLEYYHENENIDALIYVVDGSDENRIEENNKSLQELFKEEKFKNNPLLVY